jgi:ribosomal protein L7/L12
MARDETPYDVWIEWAGRDRLRAIAAVGNALCIGAKAARESIDRGQPIASGVQALEVQRLHSKIEAIGLGIRVQPEFRWRLG